MTVIFSFQK